MKQGYKSIRQAQRILDKDRDRVRLKRMGFVDGNIEMKKGAGGTREVSQ